jgi:NADH-quinone oxidoreductase subunit J
VSVTVGFAIVAACMLLSAACVVLSRRLVRAVLWLAVTLVATAALYAMQGASFLAAVQVLVYVGGVVTLMIFGVMVTRRHEGIAATLDSTGSLRAAIVAVGLFAIGAFAIETTPGLGAPVQPSAPSIADIGHALLVDHVFSFEVMSFLLLAAIIGAVVIARRKDPGVVPASGSPSPPAKAALKEAE